MSQKHRFYVLTIFCLIAVGSYVYIDGKKSTQIKIPKDSLNFNSDCLRESSSCNLHLTDGLEVLIDIDRPIVEALERFYVSVKFMSNTQPTTSNLTLWAEGRDMDMGRHFLTQINDDANLKHGKNFSGMIPICSVDENMVWSLTVSFESAGKPININLDLNTAPH